MTKYFPWLSELPPKRLMKEEQLWLPEFHSPQKHLVNLKPAEFKARDNLGNKKQPAMKFSKSQVPLSIPT